MSAIEQTGGVPWTASRTLHVALRIRQARDLPDSTGTVPETVSFPLPLYRLETKLRGPAGTCGWAGKHARLALGRLSHTGGHEYRHGPDSMLYGRRRQARGDAGEQVGQDILVQPSRLLGIAADTSHRGACGPARTDASRGSAINRGKGPEG